ncbi:putative capsid protein [Beihai sphaeromadae virus 4]|uniref:putative capsid protein n=1 Tax=Beihai sphaeromadae virus 4 TaxID=1922710 RepID=UPI000909A6B3|nr:putative capsid protein [Beihai sphaeromadae virus 4]APG76922.1 putative capsid protein [Beihai sphaeromadae virus 4]
MPSRRRIRQPIRRRMPKRIRQPKPVTSSQTLTSTYDIPIGLPSMTAFSTKAVSLDPSAHENSRASAQMSIYNKYKLLACSLIYSPSVGYDSSSGLLGVFHSTAEEEIAPQTREDFQGRIQNAGPSGCLIPVRKNKVFTVPKSVIRNIAEGYTPGATQTPGRIVIGSATSCDIDSPGLLTLRSTYQFIGPTVPATPASPTKIIKRAPYTRRLASFVWKPTNPEWFLISGLVDSYAATSDAITDVSIEFSVYNASGSSFGKSIGQSYNDWQSFIESAFADSQADWETFTSSTLAAITFDPPGSPFKTAGILDSQRFVTTMPDSTTTTLVDSVTTTLEESVTTTLPLSQTTTLQDSVTTTLQESVTTTLPESQTTTLEDSKTTTLDSSVTTTLPQSQTTTLQGSIVKTEPGSVTTTDSDSTTKTLSGSVTTTDENSKTTTQIESRVYIALPNQGVVSSNNPLPVDDGGGGFFMNLATGVITAFVLEKGRKYGPDSKETPEGYVRLKGTYPAGGDVDGVSYPDVNAPSSTTSVDYKQFTSFDVLIKPQNFEGTGWHQKLDSVICRHYLGPAYYGNLQSRVAIDVTVAPILFEEADTGNKILGDPCRYRALYYKDTNDFRVIRSSTEVEAKLYDTQSAIGFRVIPVMSDYPIYEDESKTWFAIYGHNVDTNL